MQRGERRCLWPQERILIEIDFHCIQQVFQRIAPSEKLKAFKDSIRLFMHHFLLKGGAKNGVAVNQMDLLKQRVRLADKSLDTSTLRF